MSNQAHTPPAVVWATDGGICIRLRVQPGARRESVSVMADGVPKIAICAPAVDGKANAALCQTVAAMLGVAASCVEVRSGHTARDKTLFVTAAGIQIDAVKQALMVA